MSPPGGLVVILTLLVNIAVIKWFEAGVPWGMDADGIFNARTGIWSAVLLFDNLIAIGWYAVLTRQLVGVSQRTLETAHRPCVVICRESVPPIGDGRVFGWRWRAKNIGPGTAVNVLHSLADPGGNEGEWRALGGLAAGDNLDLPTTTAGRLDGDRLREDRHLLLAEPIVGSQWTMTANVKRAEDSIEHTVRFVEPPRAAIELLRRPTAAEAIHDAWPQLQHELTQMLAALQQPAPRNDDADRGAGPQAG